MVFRASPERPADESLLDPAELARAAAMEPAARRSFLAGRLAQREFAAELLGIPARELTCDYSCPRCGSGPGLSHGRPGYSRAGVRLPLLLSLSRAGGWALVAAVTSPRPGSTLLGVDIEDPRRTDFAGFEAVALTESERRAVSGLRNGALLHERARLWARKEAWLKMTGDGLLVDPATVEALRPEVSDVSAASVGLPAGLVAAVAVGSLWRRPDCNASPRSQASLAGP